MSSENKDCSRDENIGSPCVIAFLRDRDNLKSKTVPLSFYRKHYTPLRILFSQAHENKTGITPLYHAFPAWPIWMIGIAVCTW